MKGHKVKRIYMGRVLRKVDDDITLKTAFTYFRLGVTMQ